MTLIAGLSTAIGGLITIFQKKENKKFLPVSLGFAAGVMIYVSFVEILKKGMDSILLVTNEKLGMIIAVGSFFFGIFLTIIIDKILPKEKYLNELSETKTNLGNKKLRRIGVFLAISVAIHNFPEGLATFISAIENPVLAIPVVVAIAIHNIPEGVVIAVPIYEATNSKKKAFFASLLSGLAEPLGAILGWFVLMQFMNDIVFGVLYSFVAGMMVFISLNELIPCALKYGKRKHVSIGIVSGMLLMALSLYLFI